MHKLRIKKKITISDKILDPIFSEVEPLKKNQPEQKKKPAVVVTETNKQEEPKPKNPSVKLRKKVLPSFSISINNATNKVSEPNPTQEKHGDADKPEQTIPLNKETLNKAWEDFRIFIPEDQITLRQSLKAGYPVIVSENEFSFTVSNKFQAENLQEKLPMVLDFIQERVKNYRLKMRIEVSDKVESNLVFTSNDKFKRMMEVNPALEELRKRLDLELD